MNAPTKQILLLDISRAFQELLSKKKTVLTILNSSIHFGYARAKPWRC